MNHHGIDTEVAGADFSIPAETAVHAVSEYRSIVPEGFHSPFEHSAKLAGGKTPRKTRKAIRSCLGSETQTRSSAKAPPKKSHSFELYSVPAVEFPYLKHPTKELLSEFHQFNSQLPTLPCELETLLTELPAQSSRKTLIVDLERTLAKAPAEGKTAAGFNVRPHAREFLQAVAPLFEVIVFSSLLGKEEVMGLLDPERKAISHVLDPARCCILREDYFIKDIRTIKGRDQKDVVVLSSTAFSFMNQLENSIYVPSYDGNEHDAELDRVQEFLLTLEPAEDVRPLVCKFAGLVRALKFTDKSATSRMETDLSLTELSERSERAEFDVADEYN